MKLVWRFLTKIFNVMVWKVIKDKKNPGFICWCLFSMLKYILPMLETLSRYLVYTKNLMESCTYTNLIEMSKF